MMDLAKQILGYAAVVGSVGLLAVAVIFAASCVHSAIGFINSLGKDSD